MKTEQRFDYLSKLLRSDNRQALGDYLERRELDGPLLVELDPTSACNYSCPECISRDLLNKDRISSERLHNLIHEFKRAGVQGVVFIGGGEPLAHNCMPEPIRLAHELGIAVGLTTNGSLIHRHLDTLAECASWTRVSMDAGTAETYDLFRPNKIRNSFEKVLGNMRALAEVKRGALGYSFLVMQRAASIGESAFMKDSLGRPYHTNAHEIAEAAALAKSLGCDYFEYKPMVDPQHYLVAFGPELQDLMQEQADACAGLVDDTFEIYAPRSIEFMYDNDNPVEPKSYTECPAMDLRTLVTPSGIYPCPYHRGREDKRLGSVDDGPFDVFWKSDERKRAMALTDPTRDCGFYCIRHRTNVALDSMRSMHDNGVPILDHVESEDIKDPFF